MSSNPFRPFPSLAFPSTSGCGINSDRVRSRSQGALPRLVRCLAVALILVTGLAANAQNPPPKFKPGAYRGTVSVTMSIEGVGETTTILKVKGRPEAETMLSFMAVPQTAQIILDSGDDSPLKLFGLEWDFQFGKVRFAEFVNVDDQDLSTVSILVDTFSIKGNSVYADVSYVRMIKISKPVNYNVRVRLTRVGN